MPIKPGSTVLTFSGTLSGNIYVDDITGPEFEALPFDRVEFSSERQRSVKTSTGGVPLISQNWTGELIQQATTCTGDIPRPMGTEDANIDLIKVKFNVKRYKITASPCQSSVVNSIYNLARTHIQGLQKFQLHLAKASSMDISINALLALQSETFSYLTTTGLSIGGNALDGTTENNMLITSVIPTVEYEEPLAGGSYRLLKAFTMTLENRVLMPQSTIV